jgi:hypothetical protein
MFFARDSNTSKPTTRNAIAQAVRNRPSRKDRVPLLMRCFASQHPDLRKTRQANRACPLHRQHLAEPSALSASIDNQAIFDSSNCGLTAEGKGVDLLEKGWDAPCLREAGERAFGGAGGPQGASRDEEKSSKS